MGVMRPTEYQRALYSLIAEWAEGETEPFPPLPDEMPDNGDGESNLVVNVMGMFVFTIPPEPGPLPARAIEQTGEDTNG